MENKKILLIVPHQDDELLIGGGLLCGFAASKEWETYVLYTTEGAAVNENPSIRMKEAINALKVIGVAESNIIFLGYGNGWKDDFHIYHSEGDKELTSLKGKKYTFALPNHMEYCYQKHGIHHKYTRNNYKQDLIEVIMDIKPEIIIAIDLDDHQEHMATSFFLDECMEYILKNNKNYKPLLLKKFAYDGLWKGKDDYFNVPRIPTLNGINRKNDTRNPSLLWNERIRFSNPKECSTLLFCNNILNKAMRKHKSQTGWLCSARLINDDNIYWIKRTDNLALLANIKATSGEPKYLNDFKMVDAIDVRKRDTEWGNCAWKPNSFDTKREVTIQWDNVQKIRQIVLYESPEVTLGEIKNISIHFDDGYIYRTGELIHGGVPNRIKFEREHCCRSIKFSISEISGEIGLSEIEIFEDEVDIERYKLPINVYRKDKIKYIYIKKIINFFEKNFFRLKFKVLINN